MPDRAITANGRIMTFWSFRTGFFNEQPMLVRFICCFTLFDNLVALKSKNEEYTLGEVIISDSKAFVITFSCLSVMMMWNYTSKSCFGSLNCLSDFVDSYCAICKTRVKLWIVIVEFRCKWNSLYCVFRSYIVLNQVFCRSYRTRVLKK